MSKSFLGIAVWLVIVLSLAFPVLAQETTITEDISITVTEQPTDARGAIRNERWEQLKEERETRREELRQRIQDKRAETKAKIQNLRDERKKKIIEKIQTKLTQINEKRTDHFLKFLERLSTILDKIQSRAEKAKAAGKNTTSIEAAIASARTAIATAESAVNAQKSKVYQIVVSDETKARNEVGAAMKQLQEDLRSVRETVKAASSAVHAVFQQLKSIRGVDEAPRAVLSPTVTPTP